LDDFLSRNTNCVTVLSPIIDPRPEGVLIFFIFTVLFYFLGKCAIQRGENTFWSVSDLDSIGFVDRPIGHNRRKSEEKSFLKRWMFS
jgi:hypothetical protein